MYPNIHIKAMHIHMGERLEIYSPKPLVEKPLVPLMTDKTLATAMAAKRKVQRSLLLGLKSFLFAETDVLVERSGRFNRVVSFHFVSYAAYEPPDKYAELCHRNTAENVDKAMLFDEYRRCEYEEGEDKAYDLIPRAELCDLKRRAEADPAFEAMYRGEEVIRIVGRIYHSYKIVPDSVFYDIGTLHVCRIYEKDHKAEHLCAYRAADNVVTDVAAFASYYEISKHPLRVRKNVYGYKFRYERNVRVYRKLGRIVGKIIG